MSQILDRYLSDSSLRTQLFESDFLDPNSRKERSARASARGLSPTVRELLISQNRNSSVQVESSLHKLTLPQAQFVVTGQQLGLFGGPLMTLYKIVSTLRVAELLEKETGIPTIPLFWLQSEDHDFEEIRGALFQNFTGELLSCSLEDTLSGVGDSVGRIELSASSTQKMLNEVREFFGLSSDNSMLRILKESFEAHQNLSASYESFIQRLFAPRGLLTFNPDTRIVKHHLAPLLRSVIVDADSIETILRARTEWLESKTLGAQIALRKNSPLLFISHQGKRLRFLRESSDHWNIGGARTSTSELLRIVDSEPERLTSSALLRPILQDSLFPTAAYVAGPSEFAYWAQTMPLYSFFSLSQPLVIPRANFRFVTQREHQIIEEFGAGLAEYEKSFDEFLVRRRTGDEDPISPLFNGLDAVLEQTFAKITDLARKASLHDVEGASKVTLGSMKHNFSRLKDKYIKEIARKDATLQSRFSRVATRLFPQAQPQERIVNMCSVLFEDAGSTLDTLGMAISPFEYQDTKLLIISK